MKEFTITQNDAGQRLDRFLSKAVPLLPESLMQKYIRLKRIKLGGKRVERNTRLNVGDVLQLYINDEFFETPKAENAYLTVSAPKLKLVHARPLQPHRPQYRRHRDRGQKRGGAAHPQPEDQGP